MGGSHDHGHSHIELSSAGGRHKNRLLLAFFIIAAFFVVEAIASFLTNSLALLSDAGHMLTDVVGLGVAFAAIQLAARFQTKNTKHSPHTFGLYRLEILAALLNALLLFVVGIWVLIEAVGRLGNSDEVLATEMLLVATLGLLANIAAFLLLRDGAKESLNIQGAYLEVIADMIGSVGVIVAAIAIKVSGWAWIDPVVGAAIGLWILPRTALLGRNAIRILLQSAPKRVDLEALHTSLASIGNVIDVHDIHVWTLTSNMDAATAHITTEEDADAHLVLDTARDILAADYGIAHTTIQVEPASHSDCIEAHW